MQETNFRRRQGTSEKRVRPRDIIRKLRHADVLLGRSGGVPWGVAGGESIADVVDGGRVRSPSADSRAIGPTPVYADPMPDIAFCVETI